MNHIEQIKADKRKITEEIRDQIFKRNEVEQEIKAKKEKLSSLQKKMEKVEPIFSTLYRIE